MAKKHSFERLIDFKPGTISKKFADINGTRIDEDASLLANYGDGTISKETIEEFRADVDEEIPKESLQEKVNLTSDKDLKEKKGEKSGGIEYDLYIKLLEQNQLICCQGNVFKLNQNGCFDELSKVDLRILIRANWPEKIKRLLNKQKVDEIIDRVVHSEELQINFEEFDNYSHLLNFENCVLDVRTMEKTQQDKKYLFTSYIQANYTERMLRESIFMEFINVCTQGDEEKVLLIQEIFGYCISNYCNAKKWFAFIGKPNSGKSTILEILQRLIGAKYTSAVPLHRLSERFLIAELFRKKLNISGELHNGDIRYFDTLKALTGNDAMVAERKGEAPFYFINRAKLVFAGNQMPLVSKLDSTTAFTDRIVFLLFDYSVPEEERDYSLLHKIMEERDFIVSWAIEGLKRLMQNRFVFTEPQDSKFFKKQYIRNQNNALEFVKDRCELDSHYKVLRRDLYDEYQNYCNENCMRVMTKEEFFAEISKLPVEAHKFRYRGSNPLYGFQGIALNSHVK
ncbi:phage/plasmid primase, P4 family [Paenibacillus oryzisoli]|uniref:DNA primase family protein n=1 Tax=Paenibacillus oryzisoli TaxID=1850517 RepID=UPI003D288F0E